MSEHEAEGLLLDIARRADALAATLGPVRSLGRDRETWMLAEAQVFARCAGPLTPGMARSAAGSAVASALAG